MFLWKNTSLLGGFLSLVAVASGNSLFGQSDASSSGLQDQVPSMTLPLPEHPNRTIPKPENSRPPSAQPDRERHVSTQGSGSRKREFPVPGRPSRGLNPIEDASEPESDSADEGPAEIEDPGLIRRLPHMLYDGGITLEYIYTGETFTKARGGLNRGHITNYRSNLDLVGIINTGAMNWWDGGRFFVYGQNLSGRAISTTDVGDFQLFSNLDSTISPTERQDFSTVAEYWYEHVGMDNRLRTKIGKQDANADFCMTDLGGEFIHSSFGVSPNIPLPTFPSQALGIATFLSVTDTMTLGIGVFDGTPPSGPQGVRWGFDTLGHNGATSLYQAEWKPQFGSEGQLPHTSRIGMWHNSCNDLWTELTPSSPRLFTQNYGFFYSADQMIWKEGGGDDDQGLGLFFQFGWAPYNRNPITEYYGTGLVYKGLLAGRDEDYTGVGLANVLFSRGLQELAIQNQEEQGRFETAIEVFYKYRFSPYFSLQPDLQCIANPSGKYKDALVPGMRFELVL